MPAATVVHLIPEACRVSEGTPAEVERLAKVELPAKVEHRAKVELPAKVAQTRVAVETAA